MATLYQCMKKHVASDGHILSSWYEYLFDEYLHLNNIPHDIEGFPFPDSRCRYDFLIDDVYVEIWGVSKEGGKYYNNYCQRRLKKEQLYERHNLKLISIEGKDFKRDSNDLQLFFKNKLAEFGIHSQDNQVDYPIFNRRKIDYWNDEVILSELAEMVDRNGKLPTANELLKERCDLRSAITNHGGYRKFAKLLGVQPQTKKYSEKRVVKELKQITKELGHFPCDRELQEMKRSDLSSLIKTHGGFGCFKEKVLGKRDKRPYGYWQDESNILKELRELSNQLGRFPKYKELGLIAKGIDKSKKGMSYFKNKI